MGHVLSKKLNVYPVSKKMMRVSGRTEVNRGSDLGAAIGSTLTKSAQ
jgi:hypothetical protein